MPLPTNVRPNPYQSLADQQWGDVVRAEEITPRQGLNPRSVIGHPSMVAEQSLDADDIAYGQMPVANGMRAAGWEAAANARAAEASQTLQLHGMLGNVYGRRSGVGNRALRVRRMPVSAIVPEYGTRGLGDTYLPVSKLDRGPAHFRGLGALSDKLQDYDWSGCGELDPDLRAAIAVMYLTNPAVDAAAALDAVGNVFGETEGGCALLGSSGDLRPAAEKLTADPAFMVALDRIDAATDLPSRAGYFGTLALAAVAQLSIAVEGDAEKATRALEAGEKMSEKAWWEKDKWEFKWKYLSGYTPWFKNPLYLGGGAVAGLVLYSMTKKKKGRR